MLWGKGISYTSKYYETHEPYHKTITFQQAQQVWERARDLPVIGIVVLFGCTYSCCDANLVALHTDGK